MSKNISFEGSFALWSFTIGHGRLLLRRTKSELHPTRVDILLKDTGWICMPTNFMNIQIGEVSRLEVQSMLDSAGVQHKGDDRKIFALSGSNSRGYVLAAAVLFHEDDGEYDEPSALID